MVRLWRGITLVEAAVLAVSGRVCWDTFPEGAIQPGEPCSDTKPAPPAGIYCFFEGDSPRPYLADWFGEEPVCIEVPESRVVWRGVGTYTFYNRFTNDPPVVAKAQEAGLSCWTKGDIISAPSRDEWLKLVDIDDWEISRAHEWGVKWLQWRLDGVTEVPEKYFGTVFEYLFGKEV